ncbi:uncharacterized protein KGF55_000503 [Candida pseudojiufengensis]|uniref:uncharacterized protein n=1 Tax=Candida pseudojiufengensis TaxID=497109 RepID=UPI0022242A49|nr:uncharacterized protein KGF55_000503 [Candida pseudojiufengensis]KAI5966194.1 hypothetical protein KGF55_000503 [Candida pseudojiufengensis]
MFAFSLLTPGENDHSFKAGLLSFDNKYNILADPSWNGEDPSIIDFLEKDLKNVSAILISHSGVSYISGLILLVTKYPNLIANIPVYSTLPVNQLGRISTVEYYRSQGILGPILTNLIELDEIDYWFDKFKIIKYQQNITICDGKVSITPYNSGHSLGGAFWLIVKKIDRIIYAPSWNHSRDSFLNSANFINSSSGNIQVSLLRPTAFITSANLGSPMSHKKRCEKFLQLVDATLSNGGSAIIPTSVTSRFLEVFHLVDEHLKGAPIPVYFLSYTGTRVLSYASNLLDWMSSNFNKNWNNADDSSSNNTNFLPFNPSKVDLVMDPNEIIQIPGSKIIFCSGVDLRHGDLSSKIFSYLCNDEKTTVILTEKPSNDDSAGLSRTLYNDWKKLTEERTGKVVDGTAVPLEKIVDLSDWTIEEEATGNELIEFQDKITKKRKEKLMAKVRDQKIQNLLNADTRLDVEDSSDDDEIEENEENAAKRAGEIYDSISKTEKQQASTTKEVDELIQHEAFMMENIKNSFEKHLPIDIRITHKLKPRQAMFPFFHKRIQIDDYGQVINAKDFEKTDEVSNAKIIMEGKKKFDEKRRNKHRDKDHNKQKEMIKKITPQEQVNQNLLTKYLDTLTHPVKRVKISERSNSQTQLRIRCGLAFVDLAGLVDMRSLSIIIQSIKPYNLILLPDEINQKQSGNLEQIETFFNSQQIEQKIENNKKQIINGSRYLSLANLRDGLLSAASPFSSGKMNIAIAEDNEAIKIGNDSETDGVNGNDVIGVNNFEITLDDQLVSTLKWKPIGENYKVAKVFGELELVNTRDEEDNHGQNDESPQLKKRKSDIKNYLNSDTQLNLKQTSSIISTNLSENSLEAKILETLQDSKLAQIISKNVPKLAIGNVKLPDLKKKLQSQNFFVEFKSDGTLVVNDSLAIRKIAYGGSSGTSSSIADVDDENGDIVIDGNIGPLYYKVKDCIRDMLAYV